MAGLNPAIDVFVDGRAICAKPPSVPEPRVTDTL